MKNKFEKNRKFSINNRTFTSAMTDTQKKIVQLVATGHTAAQVGLELGLNRRTVEKHLEILKYIHEAKNTPHLIHIAHRNKLIE